jgi:hypothetical protein
MPQESSIQAHGAPPLNCTDRANRAFRFRCWSSPVTRRAELFGGGGRLAALSWESASAGGAAHRGLKEPEGNQLPATANTALPRRALPPPKCFALVCHER